MADDPTTSLTPIVPCNDLDASEAFYNRLGFFQDADSKDEYADYRILGDGHGAFVHLNPAVEGWVVPGRNPFGVYLYTPDVDAWPRAVRDDIIGLARRRRTRSGACTSSPCPTPTACWSASAGRAG